MLCHRPGWIAFGNRHQSPAAGDHIWGINGPVPYHIPHIISRAKGASAVPDGRKAAVQIVRSLFCNNLQGLHIMHPVQSYSAENGNMRVQIDKTGQKCFSAAVSSVFCAVISLVYGRNRSVFNLYRTAITADASGQFRHKPAICKDHICLLLFNFHDKFYLYGRIQGKLVKGNRCACMPPDFTKDVE